MRNPRNVESAMSKLNDIPSAQILVVDDEQDHAEVMGESLRRLGHVCTIVHSFKEAQDELQHGQFDLIITDLVMDNEDDGLKVLAAAKQFQPDAETILVTAHGDVPTCKAAIKQGAYDFIEKPLDLDLFRTLSQNGIEAVFKKHAANHPASPNGSGETGSFEGIIGSSGPIQSAINTLRQIAPSNIPVLITGESGTGKELIAQAIHNLSRRSKRHFVPLNCAGLSESILEDELFGHVKGAFTGAERERQGRFEYADGGTLFLDEVGDMPLIMQAKLLRVLESGEVVRLGSNEAKHVDVRLISATNRKLDEMVKRHEFREDLYFRIKGANIHLPALRERREDIPQLVRFFIQKYSTQMEKPVPIVAEETLRLLMRFDWPGNIRQLSNAMQSTVVMLDGDRMEPRHLPPEIRDAPPVEGGAEAPLPGSNLSLDQIEKHAIRNALRVTSGNREAAAKMLGIGERTLYRKLKEYGLK